MNRIIISAYRQSLVRSSTGRGHRHHHLTTLAHSQQVLLTIAVKYCLVQQPIRLSTTRQMNSFMATALQATHDRSALLAHGTSTARTAPHRLLDAHQSTCDHVYSRSPDDAVLVQPNLKRRIRQLRQSQVQVTFLTASLRLRCGPRRIYWLLFLLWPPLGGTCL